jgi:ABC-type branched-subunit amino acid transport system permease subunit
MAKIKLIILEFALFGFFIAFMKAESMALILVLTGVAALGFYGFRRSLRLRQSLSKSFSETRWLNYLITSILVLSIPFIFSNSPYLIHISIIAVLYALMAMGLNFSWGSTNMTHFASSAFFGIGSYTAALLSIHLHTGFWINIILGSLCAMIFAVLQGVTVIKTKTYYLALVTMAFALMLYQFVLTVDFTGGPRGLLNIPYPTLFGMSLSSPCTILGVKLPFQANYFYLVVFFGLLGLICAQRLHHSWVGMTWNYIREDEIVTQCQGISVAKAKLQAFALDAVFSGFAGVFYAHYISYVGAANADNMISVVLVIMVILGGLDNLAGVVLAAILLTILPEKFRAFQDYRLMIYGAMVLLVLIFRPRGLLPRKVRIHKKG